MGRLWCCLSAAACTCVCPHRHRGVKLPSPTRKRPASAGLVGGGRPIGACASLSFEKVYLIHTATTAPDLQSRTAASGVT